MKGFQPGMKALVLVLLPFGAGGVTEEDPAAERTNACTPQSPPT